ncbi:MAG: hypothetical protein KDA60_13925, partial [Planctomycetales bacterium]|nr:hypothetical protein [Planctomycetales bacterium]
MPGRAARIEVTASQDGVLDAWIDFDGDTIWKSGEQIASLLSLHAGVNLHSFDVPIWAAPTADLPTYARFRLSREGVSGPHGPAPVGEVEDYTVTIAEREPLGPSTPAVELTHSGLDGLIAAIGLPEPSIRRVSIESDESGRDWVQMLMPGVESVLGEFGMPAVPVYRTMIGIPKGA